MKTILVEVPEQVDIASLTSQDQESQTSDNLEVLEESISLPEKYRGKSAEELAKMHMEAEKALGRRNNELGELRKYTDQVIQRQLAEATKERPAPRERKELTTEDILTSPQKAIDDAIATHPAVERVNRMEADLMQQETARKLKEFSSKHPDYQEVGQSDEFLAWASETPGRKKLYQQAAYNYDFDVADELLSQFKSVKNAKVKSAARDLQKREIKETVKDATLESATTGGSSKKILRRRDLIELAAVNPGKYYEESFQAELQQAYKEGRVK